MQDQQIPQSSTASFQFLLIIVSASFHSVMWAVFPHVQTTNDGNPPVKTFHMELFLFLLKVYFNNNVAIFIGTK